MDDDLNFPIGEPNLPADCVDIAEWRDRELEGQPGDSNYRHAAFTSLELPVSSDLLYFISRGRLSYGLLEVIESEDTNSENVQVNVTFLYQTPQALDHAKVCRLERDVGKNGVGIFVRTSVFSVPVFVHMKVC